MFKSTHLLCKKTRDDKCVYTKAPLLRVLEKQRSSKEHEQMEAHMSWQSGPLR